MEQRPYLTLLYNSSPTIPRTDDGLIRIEVSYYFYRNYLGQVKDPCFHYHTFSASELMRVLTQVIYLFVFIKSEFRTKLLKPCNSGYCQPGVNKAVFGGAAGRGGSVIVTEIIVI